MATLWLGDFRLEQLQQYQNKAGIEAEYNYFMDTSADFSWLDSTAAEYLTQNQSDITEIVFMLGLNDCIYSCLWPANYNLEALVLKYSNKINSFIEQYSKITFYFCTVGPVDLDYSITESSSTKTISKNTLNNTIKQFNNKIKGSCNINIIDSNAYLTSTNFITRDGIRYNYETLEALYNYITNQFISKALIESGNTSDIKVSYVGSGGFEVRTTRPTQQDIWYYAENPLYKSGYGMPNCTTYAWGRFYEILGEKPKLSTRNAEYWFLKDGKEEHKQYFDAVGDDYNDGYSRGQDPIAGAVMCWRKGNIGPDGAGHVAIVEHVNSDGSVETSESGWGDSRFWWRKTRKRGSDGNWGAGSAYTFQGFIYNPKGGQPAEDNLVVDKSLVTSKNEPITNDEMHYNALYIYGYLKARGWSINAIAGMLGNMQHESSINPGRFEGGGYYGGTWVSGDGPGLGLVQWTPYTNLTNWCASHDPVLNPYDIDSQLEKIINEKDTGKQYYKNHYKYTFETFSTSTDDPYTLACAFAFDYERSAVVLWGAGSRAKAAKLTEAEKEANREALRKKRGEAAEYWYKILKGSYVPEVTFENKFKVACYKIDKTTATSMSASFITKNANNGFYRVFKDGAKASNKDLVVNQNTSYEIITLTENSLVPNTDYKLLLAVTGKVGKETIENTLEFKTLQDYPNAVKNLKLTCVDRLVDINSKFNLEIKAPSYLGYWQKNLCGYDLQLFINGKQVKSKTIKNIKDISESFTIKDKFDYQCKTGDTVQIGVRVWVTDDNGNKIYDGHAAKTSKPICLLNRPIVAYLDID